MQGESSVVACRKGGFQTLPYKKSFPYFYEHHRVPTIHKLLKLNYLLALTVFAQPGRDFICKVTKTLSFALLINKENHMRSETQLYRGDNPARKIDCHNYREQNG